MTPTPSPLFRPILDRVALEREDGDQAYFHALLFLLEYLTKLTTCGVLGCLGDDVDRRRYSLEHALVRGTSLGAWSSALTAALTGPPSELWRNGTNHVRRALTQRVSPDDWRHAAVTQLTAAATSIGVAPASLPGRLPLRDFFTTAVALRNRSRGHGAPTIRQCASACADLHRACDAVVSNLPLFQLPWVHLHRNLSGKYRVTPLAADPAPYEYLKRESDVHLRDGVYLYLGTPVRTPLVFTDPDLTDIALPNGRYKDGAQQFDTISYKTNKVTSADGSHWSLPPGRLPASQTEGRLELQAVGNAFTNTPRISSDYIRRTDLEKRLTAELLSGDRHPIISLTGPGGIGKTTLAIAAIDVLLQRNSTPYTVVMWISARDVDLLDSGPKAVTPRAVNQAAIARTAIRLLHQPSALKSIAEPEQYFQQCLTEGAAGNTLFVFDNFETMENPSDVFNWLDTFIRPPNKILITTRTRAFVGDYPIEIGGMPSKEARVLVEQHAKRLGVAQLLTPGYVDDLISQANGHPYVMKMFLGDVAKERKVVAPKRIVASKSGLLRALFERTFRSLTPAAQRVFFLLCSWRVSIPEIAMEAVSLRSGGDNYDVPGALDELDRYSLVDRVWNDRNEGFVRVPLTAAEYGKSKLRVSPYRAAVEEDRKHLLEFGAGRPGSRDDADAGVYPRIENLVRAVARRASDDADALVRELPVLEFLANKVPQAYLRLAELVLEVEGMSAPERRAARYVSRFLEAAQGPERLTAWTRLAELRRKQGDVAGEIHALSELALASISEGASAGWIVNQLNGRVRALKSEHRHEIRSGDVREMIENVVEAMERQLSTLDATDCSRLGWLLVNIGKTERALDIAQHGLRKESSNSHCRNLVSKLA